MRQLAPMWTRRRCWQAACIGLLTPSASQFAMAASSTAEAEATIHKLANTIWDILASSALSNRERMEALAQAIGAKIDTTLVGRLVLGQHWRQFSDDQ